jgi:type VI secretion system secreted protein VgrG
MDDVFTFSSSAFPKTTRVASFHGREAISQPYEFEIFLLVPVDDAQAFDPQDALGARATLASSSDWKEPFSFKGVLLAVELVHAHDRFAMFRAVLAPKLQRLSYTHHSRIFTEMSVPDVLKEVFDANGLTSSDYELQLNGSYPTEEHVCQYRESDLAFVSRWMEHLGIYYFFDQSGDAEKLVVTDASASHGDLPTAPVRYVPTLDDDRAARQAIESFRYRASALPASVRIKDYDYAKPTLDVSGEAAVQKTGVGEISVYNARVFTPGDATKLANLRAEELLARQLEHFGNGTVHLRAGYRFTLDEHPLDALNQKYLVTACEHFGNLVGASPDLARRIHLPYKDTYRCEATAIPASVQFRPVRHTPWPRVYGFEHGAIDGPANSDYAQIDDRGRYNVKFFFDESTLKDGKASTFVRMMQPHGGGVEGFHFPLRKGTEVVVSFTGGDPDRPVIAGVVNTTSTPSPVSSANKTKNVIQTGGRNRFEMEDQEGQQRVTFSCPTSNSYVRFGSRNDGHEMIINTDGATQLYAGQNWDVIVGKFLTESVIEYVDEKYLGAYHKTHVAGERQLEVVHLVSETFMGGRGTKITGGDQLKVSGERFDDLGSHKFWAGPVERQAGDVGETYASLTQTVNGNVDLNSGRVVQTINGLLNQVVTADVTQTISGAFNQSAGATTIKLGPTSITYDVHHKTTLGLTEDTFIGGQMANFIGIKMGITAALSATMAMGVSLEISAAVKLGEGPIKLQMLMARIENGTVNLINKATFIKNAGFVVVT